MPLSAADRFHLYRLWESVDIVSERCHADSISPLQDRLRRIVEPYPDPSEFEKRLKLPTQDLEWYDRTAQLLKDQTDTLKVLRTAVSLAYHKSDVDYGGGMSSATREAAATIQSLISSLKFELDSRIRYEAPHLFDLLVRSMHLFVTRDGFSGAHTPYPDRSRRFQMSPSGFGKAGHLANVDYHGTRASLLTTLAGSTLDMTMTIRTCARRCKGQSQWPRPCHYRP